MGNTTNSTHEEEEYHYTMTAMDIAYVTVVTVASLLSLPSCVVIVLMYFLVRSLQTTGRAMLVQLSVADFLTASGNLLGVMWYLFRDSAVLNRSAVYCQFHSALTIFSSIASFLWTTVTAMSLFWAIVRNRPHTADKYWKVIWTLCWVIPATVAISSLTFGALGYDPFLNQASWCWINPFIKNAIIWTFMTGKAWELLTYFLTVVLYAAVKITIIRHKAASQRVLGRQSNRHVINNANVKLTFVPLVFLVLRLWGSVRFLWGYFDHDSAGSQSASWIVPLQGFGDTAQGLCNFVMDCIFTHSVRRCLLRAFCPCYFREKGGPEQSVYVIGGTTSLTMDTDADRRVCVKM